MCSENAAVLQNENPAVWHRVLESLQCRYRPIDDIEKELVEDFTFCLWRLRDEAEKLEEKFSTPTDLKDARTTAFRETENDETNPGQPTSLGRKQPSPNCWKGNAQASKAIRTHTRMFGIAPVRRKAKCWFGW
jgi:hypothetical protein